MKTTLSVIIALLSLSFSFIASATDVTINTAQTFASLDASDGVTDGVFTVNGNLTIANGGSITNNDPASPANNSAGAITIVVTGNMDIQSGGTIYAENRVSGGSGGDISITVGGTFTIRNTAILSSSTLTATSGSMNAGAITIDVTGQANIMSGSTIKAYSFKGKAGDIEITSNSNIVVDGTVISQSTGSGTGTNQGHGGMITMIAHCTLKISDSGIVDSQGIDPGADLVHLEACSVIVYGLVESFGIGHGTPSSPANHLSGTYRPGKPSNSTAGVEIWGNTITIDKLNHAGEVKANTGGPGGVSGTSWMDIIANSTISIYGNFSGNYAAYANGDGGNDNGGVLTVKSVNSSVLLRNLSIQASALATGGAGGTINVEAKSDVDINSTTIQASGNAGGGGSQHGGQINIRSYGNGSTGSIQSNGSSTLDVTGSTPADGTVNLTACGTIGFPAGNIVPATISATKTTGSCGGNPTLDAYVTLPAASCGTSCAELITLPVELVSFTTKRVNGDVQLKWITSTEVNNRGFEIQRRSRNSVDFEKVAFVDSKSLNGNSTINLQYEYNDVNNATSEVYYRLKQVDIDGHVKYSEVRVVNGMKSQATMLIYPNPAVNTDVTVSFSTDEIRNIQMTDMSGHVINNWKEYKGTQLKVNQQMPGIYMLRIMNLSGETLDLQKIVFSR